MSLGHLKANLTQITQTAKTLNSLASQFGDLSSVSADGNAAGNATLASALSDFANGWSDKRKQFISQMQGLAKDANDAVTAYENMDGKLAAALKPKESASKAGS
jgi:hypothetical protein